MYSVFTVLFVISFVLLIIGISRPSLVVRWNRRRTRGRVLVSYGSIALILLLLSVAVAPKQSATLSVQKPRIAGFYSKLVISSVSYVDGKIHINGTTDLPNGTVLDTDFDIQQKSNALYIGSSGGANVHQGKFSSIIALKHYSQYAHGSYVVTVMCKPMAQSLLIDTLLGKNGERLTGPLVQKTAGFKVLQTSKMVNLNIKVVPTVINPQKPFSPTSPVTYAYLQSYLTWMNEFYTQIKNNAAALQAGKIGLATWSAFIERNNVEGWNRYHAVDYPENRNVENPNTYKARSDVANVWSMLNAVEIDYDSFLSNHSLASKNRIPSDGQQYQQAYQQAYNDVTQ